MLYDLIGVNKVDFDSFIENIDSATIEEGAHWKHTNSSLYDSVSVKVDKYFEDQFKEVISRSNPKQGAFCGKSIFQLLEPHSKNKYILTLDVKNFFGSIDFYGIEKSVNDDSSLCPYRNVIRSFYFDCHNCLKRGLKGSAAIAEIIGLKIDSLVQETIYSNGNKNLVYSRYYDDIVISGDDLDDLKFMSRELPKLIQSKFGLSLNVRKTRLRMLHGSKVLGLRFHEGNVTVPQSFKRKVGAVIFKYYRANYDESDYESVRDAKRHVGQIIGSLRYIVNFTSASAEKYEYLLDSFYEELDRLEKIRKKLAEQDDGEIGFM